MAELKKDISDFRVFKIVFFYSILVIALPVATFFGSKYFIFDGLLSLSTVASNVWSAVVSLITLHIAVGFFIHRACAGPSEDSVKIPVKQD